MIYSILVSLLGLIPVNRDYEQAAEGINIFISSSGSHTYFVVPVATELIDWRELFPPSEFEYADSSFTYLSFGWGERAYYTQAEDWQDLNLRLVIPAAFWPTASAMHVEYLQEEPVPGEWHVPVRLDYMEYRQLCEYIIASLQQKDSLPILIPGAFRYGTDNFYEAVGQYHLFNTSNTWTNRGLKKLGVRSTVWTPLEEPVMRQVRKIHDKGQ
ncbi:MAG: DUF2459 domain-containing protein [Cytophagaceae bacterium]